MASRKVSLFSLPTLLLIGVLIALALYLLFPRQLLFEDPEYLDPPDALSIAYLRVMLRADSVNDPVRLNLARSLGRTGQLERAHRTLQPLMEQDPVAENAYEYFFDLQAQRLFAAPEGPEREAIRNSIFFNARRLLSQPYETAHILAMLREISELLTQQQYLSLLEGIDQQSLQPADALALAQEMARLQEAEGDPGAAAATLRPHLESLSAEQREAFIDNLIRLELASGNPGRALALFKRRHQGQRLTETQLNEGLRIARFAGSFLDERQWLEQRADDHPGNVQYQRELLALQLAEGRLRASLETVRRMQGTPALLSRSDRRTMAQVLEWNGRPGEALPLWTGLYRETGDQEAFTRATDLAAGLLEWDTLLSLLSLGAERRQLTADEYMALSDALVRAGRYDDALTRLAQGRARHPEVTGLTDRQLQLLIGLRRFAEAITLLEGQSALTGEQRLQLANLYWRTRRPEEALALLDFESEDPQMANRIQAKRFDLATMLGDMAMLRADYDRLAGEPGRELSPEIEAHWLNLAVWFGDYERALQLSEKRYRASGDVQMLASMAEYALALGRWEELASILGRWQEADPDATASARYWSLRALVHQRNEEPYAADQAYRTAWALAPEDETVMVSWAWLKLSELNRFADSLPPLLARLGESASDQAYPVLAFGYSGIGQPQQALRWFWRGLQSREGDLGWMIATARVMEQSGAPGMATDMRQWALSLIPDGDSSASERFALYREEGMHRLAWQELSALALNGGSESDTALREAFAFFALNQGAAQLAEALTPEGGQADVAARQRLLGALYPQPPSRQEEVERYLSQLERLDTPLSDQERAATLRDAVFLHQNFNRAVQLGSRIDDLGGFSVWRSGVSGQFSHDDLRWRASLEHLRMDRSGRLARRPGQRGEATVELDRREGVSAWSVSARLLPRYRSDQIALSGEYNRQVSDRINLSAGHHFRERTPDSAEAWWLTSRDRSYLGASYSPFSRLDLNTRLERLDIQDLAGSRLADGYALDLGGTYSIFRNDPAWTVSASYRNQRQSLAGDSLPDATNEALQQPLEPGELISEEYERAGVYTRWSRGVPHALFRSTPSPRGFVGVGAGYVLSSANPDMRLDLGLGWRVLGDDELALSGSWSSEGLDGNSRTGFNMTYTLYLGR